MKKLLLLLLIIPILFACDNEIDRGRKNYKQYYKSVLKDPDSFKVYNESYTVKGEGIHTEVEFTIDYGAKNSLGAYVRKTATIKTTSTGIIDVDDEIILPSEYK